MTTADAPVSRVGPEQAGRTGCSGVLSTSGKCSRGPSTRPCWMLMLHYSYQMLTLLRVHWTEAVVYTLVPWFGLSRNLSSSLTIVVDPPLKMELKSQRAGTSCSRPGKWFCLKIQTTPSIWFQRPRLSLLPISGSADLWRPASRQIGGRGAGSRLLIGLVWALSSAKRGGDVPLYDSSINPSLISEPKRSLYQRCQLQQHDEATTPSRPKWLADSSSAVTS